MTIYFFILLFLNFDLLSTDKVFLKFLNLPEPVPDIGLESTLVQGARHHLLLRVLLQGEVVLAEVIATSKQIDIF